MTLKCWLCVLRRPLGRRSVGSLKRDFISAVDCRNTLVFRFSFDEFHYHWLVSWNLIKNNLFCHENFIAFEILNDFSEAFLLNLFLIVKFLNYLKSILKSFFRKIIKVTRFLKFYYLNLRKRVNFIAFNCLQCVKNVKIVLKTRGFKSFKIRKNANKISWPHFFCNKI